MRFLHIYKSELHTSIGQRKLYESGLCIGQAHAMAVPVNSVSVHSEDQSKSNARAQSRAVFVCIEAGTKGGSAAERGG